MHPYLCRRKTHRSFSRVASFRTHTTIDTLFYLISKASTHNIGSSIRQTGHGYQIKGTYSVSSKSEQIFKNVAYKVLKISNRYHRLPADCRYFIFIGLKFF